MKNCTFSCYKFNILKFLWIFFPGMLFSRKKIFQRIFEKKNLKVWKYPIHIFYKYFSRDTPHRLLYFLICSIFQNNFKECPRSLKENEKLFNKISFKILKINRQSPIFSIWSGHLNLQRFSLNLQRFRVMHRFAPPIRYR